jgi:hypothetical protein
VLFARARLIRALGFQVSVMIERNSNRCESLALKLSLIFATLGLLLAFGIIGLMFGLSGVADVLKLSKVSGSIAGGVVALYVAATCLGMVAGNWACRIGVKDTRTWFIGIGLALSCLLISTLAGSSIHFFSEIGNPPDVSGAFEAYVFKPLLWVSLFGAVPALLLGIIYAASLRKFSS